MIESDRKTSDELLRWHQFEQREVAFFPPSIAALYLGLSVQGLFSAGDRGWLRFIKNGAERYYSYSDLVRYRAASFKRFNDVTITRLERHLAQAGIRPHPRYSETVEPIVTYWLDFVAKHEGSFPPRLAAMYLKISVSSVLVASKRGWIRSFLIGRENYYSRRDVISYWQSGSRKNLLNRPCPPFFEMVSMPP